MVALVPVKFQNDCLLPVLYAAGRTHSSLQEASCVLLELSPLALLLSLSHPQKLSDYLETSCGSPAYAAPGTYVCTYVPSLHASHPAVLQCH